MHIKYLRSSTCTSRFQFCPLATLVSHALKLSHPAPLLLCAVILLPLKRLFSGRFLEVHMMKKPKWPACPNLEQEHFKAELIVIDMCYYLLPRLVVLKGRVVSCGEASLPLCVQPMKLSVRKRFPFPGETDESFLYLFRNHWFWATVGLSVRENPKMVCCTLGYIRR